MAVDPEALKEARYAAMVTEPVVALVSRLAVPTIACMMISSLYNMVDAIFVGKLTTQAVAAIGVCYPFMTFVQAFGYFFAQGSGNYISRAMGAHRFEDAEEMAVSGMVYAMGAGLLFSCLGGMFLEPLARLLGAYGDIMADTLDYLRWLMPGIPFMMGSIVMNIQFRFQGAAMRSMIGIGCGAVVNVILDPVFIFALDMKVAGAALSTLIGQACGFAVLLHQMGKHGAVKLRIGKFRFSTQLLKEMLCGGTPSFFRQGLGSVSNICLNMTVKSYGTAAVAAFSATARVMNLATSAVNGFGQGFQPVCGFNYGAKRYDRVKKAYRFTVAVELAACLAFSALGMLLAETMIGLVREGDAQVLAIGTMALRLQCVTFPLICVISTTNMMTQVMGKVTFATLEAMSRQGLFFVPAVLVLSRLFGLAGAAWAQPFSDACAAVISIVILRLVWNELKDPDDPGTGAAVRAAGKAPRAGTRTGSTAETGIDRTEGAVRSPPIKPAGH